MALEVGACRRSAALGEGGVGDWSAGFGRLSAGGAGEVAVFEAVAVALEREDLGVVDEAVDHRGGDDVARTFDAGKILTRSDIGSETK